MKYTIEQITARHVNLHSNVSPRDIGLWCYFINGRPYGFAITEEQARAKAEAGVGTL